MGVCLCVRQRKRFVEERERKEVKRVRENRLTSSCKLQRPSLCFPDNLQVEEFRYIHNRTEHNT